MDNKPMINVTFTEITLKQVNFRRAEDFDKKQYEIKVDDIIEVTDVKPDSFVIEFIRKTRADIPFSFNVLYIIKVKMDQVGIDYYGGQLDKITNFADKRKIEIVSNLSIPARASLVISNITKEIGNPFITPALIIKENNE